MCGLRGRGIRRGSGRGSYSGGGGTVTGIGEGVWMTFREGKGMVTGTGERREHDAGVQVEEELGLSGRGRER